MLQERVGRESITQFTATGCIEFDEVAGNILQLGLGALLHALPLTRSQMRQTRRLTIVLRLVFRHLVQRVDGNVYRATTIVHDLNHFLIAIALWHSDQSTKLTDAVIYMHHVVTHLKLLNLFERQCHLARTRLVGRQTVLMVTVKNLVVSKYAEPQVIVSEAFVQGLFDGGEIYSLTSHFSPLTTKYVLQTLQLLLAVCENAELVAISQILFEGLLQQIEVLVELGLGRDMERDSGIRQARGTMTHLNATEIDSIARELGTTNQLTLLLHLLHNLVLLLFGSSLQALRKRLFGEALLIDTVDGIANIQEVLEDQYGFFRQERQERHLFLSH